MSVDKKKFLAVFVDRNSEGVLLQQISKSNQQPKPKKNMKVKLSKQQIDSILADPKKAQEAGVKTSDPGGSSS